MEPPLKSKLTALCILSIDNELIAKLEPLIRLLPKRFRFSFCLDECWKANAFSGIYPMEVLYN